MPIVVRREAVAPLLGLAGNVGQYAQGQDQFRNAQQVAEFNAQQDARAQQNALQQQQIYNQEQQQAWDNMHADAVLGEQSSARQDEQERAYQQDERQREGLTQRLNAQSDLASMKETGLNGRLDTRLSAKMDAADIDRAFKQSMAQQGRDASTATQQEKEDFALKQLGVRQQNALDLQGNAQDFNADQNDQNRALTAEGLAQRDRAIAQQQQGTLQRQQDRTTNSRYLRTQAMYQSAVEQAKVQLQQAQAIVTSQNAPAQLRRAAAAAMPTLQQALDDAFADQQNFLQTPPVVPPPVRPAAPQQPQPAPLAPPVAKNDPDPYWPTQPLGPLTPPPAARSDPYFPVQVTPKSSSPMGSDGLMRFAVPTPQLVQTAAGPIPALDPVNAARQYETLPSGTLYMAPDGTTRRKP